MISTWSLCSSSYWCSGSMTRLIPHLAPIHLVVSVPYPVLIVWSLRVITRFFFLRWISKLFIIFLVRTCFVSMHLYWRIHSLKILLLSSKYSLELQICLILPYLSTTVYFLATIDINFGLNTYKEFTFSRICVSIYILSMFECLFIMNLVLQNVHFQTNHSFEHWSTICITDMF